MQAKRFVPGPCIADGVKRRPGTGIEIDIILSLEGVKLTRITVAAHPGAAKGNRLSTLLTLPAIHDYSPSMTRVL